MAFIQYWLSRLSSICIGLVFVAIPFARLILKSLFRGWSVWSTKPRPLPPACLNDPAYGNHRYIKLKNIKLHYVEAGDHSKPLVVFLHGFPEFWYSWRHQIKYLKQSFWTVAVDMRGYGGSDKPAGVESYHINLLTEDIVNLIKGLGRSSCYLIAHDWGGVVAYYMAKHYPQYIDKMIILNSPHLASLYELRKKSWKQFFKSWYIYFFQTPFLPELFLTAEDAVMFDQIFRDVNKSKKLVSDDDIEAFKYTFSSRDKWTAPIHYYRNLSPNFEKVVKTLTGKITVPTLIIWGCNDLALETKLAQSSSEHFTKCIVKYIENAGHFVQQDSPVIVNDFIDTYLKTE
ncbi:Epoxide hydrolase 4 [Chamberlinius hualienensis]